MALDASLRERLEQVLTVVDEHGTTGPRLVSDAVRLWRRIGRFLGMNLVTEGLDADALELACYAMQLPLRRAHTQAGGRPARMPLRERAEEAAELLLNVIPDADEALLDRTTRVLQEMPHRSPMLDEARLLADAINLEDFGVTGLVQQALQVARQGEGVLQLAEGLEKREQYGYWNARLRDGFHFDPIREIARRRLDNARHVALLLLTEIREDS
ncbi:MAG TPA: hypothetical protein VGI81_13070 [Tepidisphaeraceae bacterium]